MEQMNTERQPGYYRVKYSNKWTFGEYWWSKYHDSFRWSILGIKGSFTDEVFDKDENDKPSIIETPISPSPTTSLTRSQAKELIANIKVNKANFDYIAQYGIINGSLLSDLEKLLMDVATTYQVIGMSTSPPQVMDGVSLPAKIVAEVVKYMELALLSGNKNLIVARMMDASDIVRNLLPSPPQLTEEEDK